MNPLPCAGSSPNINCSRLLFKIQQPITGLEIAILNNFSLCEKNLRPLIGSETESWTASPILNTQSIFAYLFFAKTGVSDLLKKIIIFINICILKYFFCSTRWYILEIFYFLNKKNYSILKKLLLFWTVYNTFCLSLIFIHFWK